MDVMLPTLRAERAATYSPVLPISPKSGIVLQVPVEVSMPRPGSSLHG
jgi:lysyl-tRNA synthetase class 1